MNPFEYIASFFADPDYKRDAAYKLEQDWADTSPTLEVGVATDKALEHARTRYTEAHGDLERLERKLADLQKLSSALAVGLFAAVRLSQVPSGFLIHCSFGLLTVSLAISAIALRAVLRPGLSSIRDVVDAFVEARKISQEANYSDLLVRSLHLSVTGSKYCQELAARHLLVASWLVVGAIACLALVVLTSF